MKKLPSTFIIMAMISLMMFFFIARMMHKAESDLKKLEHKRKTEGGANPYEKQLNSLL